MPDTATNLVNWRFVTADDFHAEGATPDTNSIYFLNNGELYRGSQPFNEACVVYSGVLPTNPARKKIYVNSANGEGKIFTGTDWVTVIKPIADTVGVDGTDPVNSKAVIDYVTQAIADVTGGAATISGVVYSKDGIKMTVTKGDGTSVETQLEGIAVGVTFDAETGELKLVDVKGNPVGTTVNLGLDRFVKSAEYDHDTKTITLYFDDEKTDKLDIPVGDLVDTYTAESSQSVTLTVTGNKFAADVIVSEAEGNMLSKTENGLYVAATDTSKLMALVETANTNAIPMLNAAGQIINGTKTAGGEAIAETPAATVLATELAVATLVANTKATIDAALAKKMALVEDADTTKIPMLNAAGQIINGTKTVGGATLAATPDANTLATEVAVKAGLDAAATAADDKYVAKDSVVTVIDGTATTDEVASAKAVLDALTWKTNI